MVLGRAQGEEARRGLVDEGDLGLEVYGKRAPLGRREGGAFGSVEAGLEGVPVARLTTAATMGGDRGGHETSIAQMFSECKRYL
jgi:hypothetical protein